MEHFNNVGFDKMAPKHTNQESNQNNSSVILILGPHRPQTEKFLKSLGDDVIQTEEKISSSSELLEKVDFIISYGYKHILTEDIIDKFADKIINLHISLLPWNRGTDPNLWSFLENTPKGVTIHHIDHGIDTGDIIAQKEVEMRDDDTLKTSYERLSEEIEQLFKIVWTKIKKGKLKATPQPKGGSFHRYRDKKPIEHLLTNGWDTPVACLGLAGKAYLIK